MKCIFLSLLDIIALGFGMSNFIKEIPYNHDSWLSRSQQNSCPLFLRFDKVIAFYLLNTANSC